jgi:hypothetical protein
MEFEDAVGVAEQYAVAVGDLKRSLNEARLSFVGANLVLQSRYAELHVGCVPTTMAASLVVKDTESWLVGAPTAPTPSSAEEQTQQASAQRPAAERSKLLSAEGEAAHWQKDPATWFCGVPPRDLVDCQAAFVNVVRAAAAVARLRSAALEALNSVAPTGGA